MSCDRQHPVDPEVRCDPEQLEESTMAVISLITGALCIDRSY